MEDLPHLDSEDVNDIQQEQEAHNTVLEISFMQLLEQNIPRLYASLASWKIRM